MLGENILLIMPQFFGYEQEVIFELERRGAIVDWLPDRPFDSSIMKAATKLGPNLLLPYADNYYRKLLKSFDANSYSKIFVVNGQTLSYKFLKELRSTYPAAEVVLYMWDSINNRPNIIKNLPLFDKALSFDQQSVNEFGFYHRPLFFSPGFKPSLDKNFNYHLSFIGTTHSDRYEIISKVKGGLSEDIKTFWYLYLQAHWVFTVYKLTNPSFRHAKKADFHFQPLKKSIVQSIFSNSFGIFDIEHPRQTGLTMRSLEAFGAHKKLVTTNRAAEEHDFYDQRNICIIDRKNPKIPKNFFAEPFSPVPKHIYEKYSLKGWVDEIFK